jgi:hypothetical protein
MPKVKVITRLTHGVNGEKEYRLHLFEDEGKVVTIEEHLPQFEGDRLYYNIHFEFGHITRIFNPCEVYITVENQ